MSAVRALCVLGSAVLVVSAKGQVTYQLDGWPPALPTTSYEIFNNSVGTETEDGWVANSFQVQPNGFRINSLTFALGAAETNRSVTATLYTGSSLTVPSGLSRIVASTTTVSITGIQGSLQTINFPTPIDLANGQIFYAALLIRQVVGTEFPFVNDNFTPDPDPPFLQRSFFDVGPTIGGAYNLDNTSNATRLGSSHPVLGGAAQSAANLVLRVNATPEPGSLAVVGMGLMALAARRRH